MVSLPLPFEDNFIFDNYTSPFLVSMSELGDDIH